MSNPHLPPELLDLIVDLLHDDHDALKACCLISKSWIPRTRKHIFVDIVFVNKWDLKWWKDTFPDPSTSPAHYADTLFIECPYVVTAADAEAGGWVRGFSRVVGLMLDGSNRYVEESFLVPFHKISPILKTLHVYFDVLPLPQISTSPSRSRSSRTHLGRRLPFNRRQ